MEEILRKTTLIQVMVLKIQSKYVKWDVGLRYFAIVSKIKYILMSDAYKYQ